MQEPRKTPPQKDPWGALSVPQCWEDAEGHLEMRAWQSGHLPE